MKWTALFFVMALPAAAEPCPPLPDRAERLAEIYGQLRDAETPATAQSLSGELWMIWLQAPDAKAQELLDTGMRHRQIFDFAGSVEALDLLVDYCPDYAEGYNQRAFTNFLARDFDAALVDLDVALALNPRHLGALTGKGLTLLGLGREGDANLVLREALELNPWLSERALITDTDI